MAMPAFILMVITACSEVPLMPDPAPGGNPSPAPVIMTSSLVSGMVGSAYAETLAASGGDGNLTWRLSSGVLPLGLTLAPSTGLISGLPTSVGVVRFSVVVTSGDGQADTEELSISIAPSVSASLAHECDRMALAWIWCDDFDVDRLGSYFERGQPGSFTRDSRLGIDESFAMRAHFTQGLMNAGDLKLAFGRTPSTYFAAVDGGMTDYRDIYWRVYVRYQVGWIGGGGEKFSRATVFAGADWSQAAIGHVWSGGADEDFLALDPASGTDEAGTVNTTQYNDFPNLRWLGSTVGTTPLFASANVGEWYCVETHMRLNDAGVSNGVFEYWIDNGLEAQSTGLNWVGAYDSFGINAILLENFWNGGSPATQDRFFDNFVVSSERIGCGG